MGADPVTHAMKSVTHALASTRLHQMKTDRAGTAPCDHTISTLHHGRRGLPIFAQCRRTEEHPGLHEDEYGRRWHTNGVLASADEA